MNILTNGINFQSLKQSITLQSQSVSQITLRGTPSEIGQLEIQGYTTRIFGVKSNCRLKHMRSKKFPVHYLVDVVPPLPEISVKTSLQPSSTIVSSSNNNSELIVLRASLMLYDGETAPCVITIINESDLMIEHLEFTITSNLSDKIKNKVFQYNLEDIQVKYRIHQYWHIFIIIFYSQNYLYLQRVKLILL